MKIAKVGVLVEREAAERKWTYGLNVFEKYIEEIFAHAGVPYAVVDGLDAAVLETFDMVIAACVTENSRTADRLWSYAEQGGTVIAYGGVNSLAARLGYIQTGEAGVGYAELVPTREGQPAALRYLSAVPWVPAGVSDPAAVTAACAASGALRQGCPDGAELGPALQAFTIGQGSLRRWAVNIPLTIVQMQQGTGPVLDDGVPAADGSANVNEDILKADDRIALDWQIDRVETETGIPFFPWPYADYWREALIRHVVQCALDTGLTLPFTGYWPEGVERVAMISHDSDGNQDSHALTALKLLEECGLQTTWCMLEPGYSADVYAQAKQAGHELAFHYNALEKDGGAWGEAAFARQFGWLKQAIGAERVATNKNHYTRVEGWGELFRWLERSGIQSDQTRGPSKKGNVGFLFGTCHPYFPIALFDEQNRLYDVVEIGFLTQDLDLGHLADRTVIRPFLEQVREVDGVAHFLFHQVHIHTREEVRDVIRLLVAEARGMGFTFWLSKEIQDWTRARRGVRITACEDDGTVWVEAAEAVEGLVAWVPLTGTEAYAPEQGHEVKFGVPCRKVVVSSKVEISGRKG
ncbi:hypothetical protein ABE504_00115 [Paenibacillus oryzisoli]|uniref:hypothetical protein n=1 Tax=Paenibacillus oryzisoli TaxID=1850517 RepID=UPI003D2B6A81